MEINIPSLLRIKPNAIHKIGKYLRTDSFSEIALFFSEGIKALFFDKIQISLESSEVRLIY